MIYNSRVTDLFLILKWVRDHTRPQCSSFEMNCVFETKAASPSNQFIFSINLWPCILISSTSRSHAVIRLFFSYSINGIHILDKNQMFVLNRRITINGMNHQLMFQTNKVNKKKNIKNETSYRMLDLRAFIVRIILCSDFSFDWKSLHLKVMFWFNILFNIK